MKENYKKGSKKHKFFYFFLTSLLQLKKNCSVLIASCFYFVPDYCIPSDYSGKEELIITNYDIFQW